MLKKDVVVGGRYIAKISGKMTVVRIERVALVLRGPRREATASGWVAINETTGREVRIKSAAKLRQEARAK